MGKLFLFCLIILSSLSFSITSDYSPSDSRDAYIALIKSVKSVQSMEFTLINHERVDGKMLRGVQKIAMTNKPFQCYIQMIEPGKGQELVYAGAKYDYEAIYEPGGFPYLQMSLDPYGSLMRDRNHHTIFFLGFDKMMSIIDFHVQQSKHTISAQDLVSNGKSKTKIVIEFEDYRYLEVVLEKEEDLNSFSERLALNDFMISELNDIDLDETLKVGRKLVIPTAYCKKVELIVDQISGLPDLMIVSDEKGIYEKYEFQNLRTNHSISPQRFDAKMLGKAM